MRIFLAIELDPEVRERVHRDAGALRAAAPDVAWVRAENLHVTLKFLGEVADTGRSALTGAVRDAARRHVAFRLPLQHIGAFPSLRRPRIVWLGARANERVAALARDLDGACSALGFAREERDFAAHVTLGRVRHPLGPAQVRALTVAAGTTAGEYDVAVRAVAVMKSELTPQGSRYTALSSLPLRTE